jgi:hypothetical protein
VRTPTWQDRSTRAVLPVLLVVLAIASLAGCSRPSPPPLSHTFESPDALAREVLARLARNDKAGLQALALTRDEFAAHVYPKLPASRPERNTSLSFVWGRLKQQSDLSLAANMARHGGRGYTLQEVTFEGETSDYGTFTVQRESVLVVRTTEGVVERIRIFGSMLVMDGRYKVFSYVTD